MSRSRRHLHAVGDEEPKRGRGQPAKSLQQHYDDGTFRARLHEQLLDDEELLDDPAARKLQQRFRRLKTPASRRAAALDLERVARASAPERADEAAGEFEARVRRLGKPRSARQAIGFFEEFYVWDDGSPWILDPLQKEFLRDLLRRDRADRLIYKEAGLGICRGQGKTPIASGLGTHAIATADIRTNVFQVAGSKLQASLGTEYSINWIDDNPELAKLLRAQKKSISRRDGLGSYSVLSSDGRLAHGRRGRIKAIADELWLYKSYAEEQAYVALESALHKDPESQLLWISTAGYNLSSLLGRKYRRGLACPQIETRRQGFLTIGRDPDAGYLMWWFGMPDGYELDLENDAAVMKALKLANPGSWTDHRAMLQSLRRAQLGDVQEGEIRDELEWLRLCLNYWTTVRGSWFKPGVWRSLADSIEIPDGAEIYVGVDSAWSRDSVAVAWAWRAPDGRIVVRVRVWSLRERTPAHHYLRNSYYDVDDRHVAEAFILDQLAGRYRIRELVADPTHFGPELRKLGHRFPTAPIWPGSNNMRAATENTYQRVNAGRVAHDGNNVLASHVDAIAGEKDKHGYWHLEKLDGAANDGGIAAVIAIGRAAGADAAVEPWAATW